MALETGKSCKCRSTAQGCSAAQCTSLMRIQHNVDMRYLQTRHFNKCKKLWLDLCKYEGDCVQNLTSLFLLSTSWSALLSQLAIPKLRGSSTCAVLIPARYMICCLIESLDQMSYLHVISCCNPQLCSSQIAHEMQYSQRAQQAQQTCSCWPCTTVISCDEHASSMPC